MLAVACAWIGVEALIPTPLAELVGSVSLSADEDTARSVLVGVGVSFLLLAIGAVYGPTWVFRRWPRARRE